MEQPKQDGMVERQRANVYRYRRYWVECACGWHGTRANVNNTHCPRCEQPNVKRHLPEIDDLPGEEWREIPGFDGRYLVSNLGRLFSSPRRRARGGLITQTLNERGYLRVCLYPAKTKSRRLYYVHRLVLLAFVGGCPDGMECLHGNGRSTDNRLANLRWGTRAENFADLIKHGKWAAAIKRAAAARTLINQEDR